MGASPSRRVHYTLRKSTDFNSACESVFQTETALAQHAFAGIKPYQLFCAAERLYHTLTGNSSNLPLIKKWAPSPPSREQVNRAFKALLPRIRPEGESENDVVLGEGEFKEFSVDVFSDVIVLNARNEVLKLVSAGVIGIAGVGMVVRPGRTVVGMVMGIYTLGVTAAVYLSL